MAKLNNFGAKKLFASIILALCITDLAILLNIPFLRQILGFLFLTILPGLLILQILKLDKIGIVEKFVLSVGLSVSFLMFFGLFIDKLYFSLGYTIPLSTISLVVSFSAAMIILCVIGYKTKTFEKSFIKTNKNWLQNLNLSTSEKAFLVVPILFPALSIFGTHVMNTTDNNAILIFLLFLIPIYVVFMSFFNHRIPKRIYPVTIFLISISLILLWSLRTNHPIGIDTQVEYHFFQMTFRSLHWSISEYSILNACLSITLLPTIYQSILNVNSEYLFKLLYPLIFSLSPLVVYVLSKKYVGEGYAFLASFFFMSQKIFIWATANARTVLAVFFFALAIMVLFNDGIDTLKKRILFMTFMASGIVSHYSTTYLFFFIILTSWLLMEIFVKIYTFKKIISITLVFLFFGLIFFWYSQITVAAFNTGVQFFGETFLNLNEFFVAESHSGHPETLLGKDIMQKGIPHKLEFVSTWAIFVLIGIGVLTLLKKHKKMVSFSNLENLKPDFLKRKFDVGYFVLMLACSGVLVGAIAIPHALLHYDTGRWFAVPVIVLSVILIIGGIALSKYLRVRPYLLILLVIIPYFFCCSSTALIYQAFDVPRSIILNSDGGEQYDWLYRAYFDDQKTFAKKWSESSDVVDGKLLDKIKICNMTEYLDMVDEKSRVYNNGNWEILIRRY